MNGRRIDRADDGRGSDRVLPTPFAPFVVGPAAASRPAGPFRCVVFVSLLGNGQEFGFDRESPGARPSAGTAGATPRPAQEPGAPGRAVGEVLDLAAFKRGLGSAPAAHFTAEGGLRERPASEFEHSECYRRARAASTQRSVPVRPAPAPRPAPEPGDAELLDLAAFKRSLGSAPAARFTAEGGLHGPWDVDIHGVEWAAVALGARPARPRNIPHRGARGPGRRWFGWARRPWARARAVVRMSEWEARARERQVAEARKAAVVLLAYSAFALCWWLATDVLR